MKPTPAAPAATIISAPRWHRWPNADDVARVYPHTARDHGVSGSASVTCVVTATGAMRQCVINEEYPTGMGFGDAALRLAPRFTMNPKTSDGHPVEGGQVRIPLRFVMQQR